MSNVQRIINNVSNRHIASALDDPTRPNFSIDLFFNELSRNHYVVFVSLYTNAKPVLLCKSNIAGVAFQKFIETCQQQNVSMSNVFIN